MRLVVSSINFHFARRRQWETSWQNGTCGGCATRRTTCTYLGNHEKTVTRCLHNTHSHPDPGQNVLNTVSSQLHATLVSDCRVNIAVARKVFVVARHVGLAIEYTVSHSRKTLTSPFHIDFHNRHYGLYSPNPEAKAKAGARARARAVLQSLSSLAHCTLFLTVADHAGKQCHDRLTAFIHAFSCGFLCFRTNLKNQILGRGGQCTSATAAPRISKTIAGHNAGSSFRNCRLPRPQGNVHSPGT